MAYECTKESILPNKYFVRKKEDQMSSIIPTPTNAWAHSTPEEQGMESVKLAELLRAMIDKGKEIESLLIVRNGRLVIEVYRYPYHADALHQIMSCSKSFTSAMIGIAIGEGKIKGTDQPVAEFLLDYDTKGLSTEKRSITVENLLTMSGGFEWLGGMLESPTLREMGKSTNWVQFVLDRHLSDQPGKRFVYNTGSAHLLSAILQHAVNMKTEEYANKNLFSPLGIKDWYWSSDPQGVSTGGFGLWLKPQDMAKFGYLYLNHGRWGNSQVIPEKWVSDSVCKHIDAGGKWLSDAYGYQWWVDKYGYYMALGFGGQFIVVVPDRNLVLVTTGSLMAQDFFEPELLLNKYILPASESSVPLPSRPSAVTEMNNYIFELTKTEPRLVSNFPQTASRISGETYMRSAGTNADASSGPKWKTVSFVFEPGKQSALLIDDGTTFEIGLDGLFRGTDPFAGGANIPFPRCALDMRRGYWTDENTFSI
jgi:CubicO group peptidase (beta-lactamase class C family)